MRKKGTGEKWFGGGGKSWEVTKMSYDGTC